MLRRTLLPWVARSTPSRIVTEMNKQAQIFLKGSERPVTDLSGSLSSAMFADNDHLCNMPETVVDMASLPPEFLTPERERLSNRLIKLSPVDKNNSAVWMAADGRDIISTAVWASTTTTGHPYIFRMDKSYHGASYHAAQVGTDSRRRFKDNGHVWVETVGEPIPRPTSPDEVERCLEAADRTVQAWKHKARTIVIEGSSGTAYGGVYPDGYIAELFQIFRDNGVKIIVDEILSGYQRTGPGLFAAIAGNNGVGAEHPVDYVCYGKAVTNGTLPFAALVVSDATVYDEVPRTEAARWPLEREGPKETNEFGHGATFSGYPMGVWAAHQTLDRHQCSAAHVQHVTGVLDEQLATFEQIPVIRDIRGKGMLRTIELNANDAETARIKAGLMDTAKVRVFGRENRLVVSPAIGVADLEDALGRLRGGLSAVMIL